jgi:hypothetical protein
MITGIIYNEMVSRNLTTSMRAWSEEWAGRSHNFATTHWEKPLPPETALYLRKRLIEAGHPDLAAVLLLSLIGELPLWRDGQACEVSHGA